MKKRGGKQKILVDGRRAELNITMSVITLKTNGPNTA